MSLLSTPAFGPKTSLAYITAGTLLDVWVAVWYFAFGRGGEGPMSNTGWFWVVGLFLTGATLILIGALLGPIGRFARHAELPPVEATHAEAVVQTEAAQRPVVVAGAAAAPAPNGTVDNANMRSGAAPSDAHTAGQRQVVGQQTQPAGVTVR